MGRFSGGSGCGEAVCGPGACRAGLLLELNVVEAAGVPKRHEVAVQRLVVQRVTLLGKDQGLQRVLGNAARAPELNRLDDIVVFSPLSPENIGRIARLMLKDLGKRLRAQGIGATVVDPRWAIPVQPSIVDLAREHRLVITIEDGIRVGGGGTRVRQVLREADRKSTRLNSSHRT